MKRAIEIFTSKANLEAFILNNKNTGMRWEMTIKLAKNYETNTQDYFHITLSDEKVLMSNETFTGDMMTPDVDIYREQDFKDFISEMWYHFEKRFARISGLMIQGEIQDLEKMAAKAAKADAEKVLNKAEIADQSIGMVKVMDKVDAKLILEGDNLLLELMDVVGNIMTRRRGVQSFGLSKHDMKWQMEDVCKIQEILNKVSMEMASAMTMEAKKEQLDKIINL